MGERHKPQRQWTLHFTLSADTEEEVGAILRFIAYEWETAKHRASFDSDGIMGDFHCEVIHRPEMSPQQYHSDLRAHASPHPRTNGQ